MPPIYSSLIKLSSKIPPENSVRECLAQSAQRIAEELPVCARYAICFSQLNRLIRACDRARVLPPNDEEFAALFDHLSRHTLKQARTRFPELWDEVQGHYVLDSRGAVFATALVTGLRDRGYLHHGSRFVDVGSGTGTMVAAVQRYSAAHATGIEKHAGVMRLAKSMLRRLQRAQGLTQTSRANDEVQNKSVNPNSSDANRPWHRQIELVVGDCFESTRLDLSRYDVLYVYSPLRKWEIDVDRIIDRMQIGAILATSKSPRRNRRFVERLDPVAELSCFRKTKPVSDQPVS